MKCRPLEDVSKAFFNRREREAGAKCAKLKNCKYDPCDLCEFSLQPLRFIFTPFYTSLTEQFLNN